jgi:LysR family hydrogen peroxide-inducible transcriptional activator
MPFTLRQIRYLIALHTHGSFSHAAENCYVTQSTLSAGIQDLEALLGRTLVNRQTKPLSLTAWGQDFLNDAQSLIEHADQMESKAKEHNAPLSGPLRLGIIPTIAPYYLPEILPQLTRQFPNLQLQIYEDLTHRLIEKLEKNQIDAALMALPFDTPNMHQDALFSEPFVFAKQADTARAKSYPFNMLEAENVLLLEDGHCLRDHAISACKIKPKSSKDRAFSATSLPTLLEMVAHGYGVTLLPDMAAKALQNDTRFDILPFKMPRGTALPSRTIGIVWPKKSLMPQDLSLLSETLKDIAS